MTHQAKFQVVGFLALGLLLCGFDMTRHSIPLDKIHSGGPPKDGIPALLRPRFVSAKKAASSFMKKNDRVLGLALNGEAKAYPIKILNWHEIVNDKVGGHAMVITFCPLCGTGMVFDATLHGKPHTFGVSGLLYQSDLLLYDHQTESLWSQIKSEAVAGKLTGTRLKLVPAVQTTWGQWVKLHPETKALSINTGYRRNYGRNPYEGYDKSFSLMFEVNRRSANYHPKERVLGITLGSVAKAYSFSELAKQKSPFSDKINGTPVQVLFDKASQTARIQDARGRDLPSVIGFWFAWYTFHPDTQIFKGKTP